MILSILAAFLCLAFFLLFTMPLNFSIFLMLIHTTTCTKCQSCTHIRVRNKTSTVHFRKERGKETHYSNYFEDSTK